MSLELIMSKVDAVTRDPRYRPLWGWHDDHILKDGTPDYLPAIQQVRGEFRWLLQAIIDAGLVGGRCLQLGLGPGCSHEVWRCVFNHVVSVEKNAYPPFKDREVITARTADAVGMVGGGFDFLFIDAGHLYDDVKFDYLNYYPKVRPGGIIAFHDAFPRKGVAVEVHRFIDHIPNINIVGSTVGTAWMVKP